MMIPEKYIDVVRNLASENGREDALAGRSREECEWMCGTIFHDDYMDAFDVYSERD